MTTYTTTIYQLTRESDGYFIAYILSLKSRKPSTMSGYETQVEFDTAVKEHYGVDTVRVPKKAFWEEVERRSVHTPEMLAVLRDSYMGDLTGYHVYGAPMRPMSGSWARIDGAVFINADKSTTGYHTYVVVPELLDRDTIERYELRFVSGPEK
jgi:hypothetical protein